MFFPSYTFYKLFHNLAFTHSPSCISLVHSHSYTFVHHFPVFTDSLSLIRGLLLIHFRSCTFPHSYTFVRALFFMQSRSCILLILSIIQVWLCILSEPGGMLFPGIELILGLRSTTNCIKKGGRHPSLINMHTILYMLSKSHYAYIMYSQYSNNEYKLTYIHVDIYSNRVTNSPVLLKN